jgi:translocator protein
MTKSILQNDRSTWIELVVAVAICQAAGLIGLLIGGPVGKSPWYRSLKKPGFAPAENIIGKVWVALYTLMGFALQQLWQQRGEPEARGALRAFGLQWILNALWTPIFFKRRSISGALGIIVGLWAALTATTVRSARVSLSAAVLLFPIWLWVGFATALNIGFVALNPDRRIPASLDRAARWIERREQRRR